MVCNTDTKSVVAVNLESSSVFVPKDRSYQLVAKASYDDGTTGDVSNSAEWEIIGDPTVANISNTGLLTGLLVGTTELTASKSGITSDTVAITVCDFIDCIDVFDVGSGKLFTSSPSESFSNSISASHSGTISISQAQSDFGFGPVGTFSIFTWAEANSLCSIYNTEQIAGRSNWRLATREELEVEVLDKYDDMFTERSWPVNYYYWSSTVYATSVLQFYLIRLSNTLGGVVNEQDETYQSFVSCVSNP